MKRFCANCGASLNENSQFCSSCGAKTLHPCPVNESPSNPPSIQPENTTVGLSRENRPKKSKVTAEEIRTGNPIMTGSIFADASGGEMSFVHSLNSSGN
ncbi:MAG: zinc-ribbon domain-containing protein, partial [Clostridiaceae bacterium]|nr:zinc-ribbon domain-containing protein [Clostridiaceae bacterium]